MRSLLKPLILINARSIPMISTPLPWVFNGFSWRGGHYRHDIHSYNLFFKSKYIHSLHFKEDSLHNLNHLQNIPLVINNLLLQNIHNITSIKKVELDETILEFANCFTSFVFYFPYILDWRGRIYPNVTYSHHHSVLAKLLIHFHYKEPLNDKGFLALQLHAANLYGLQLSREEKIKWFHGGLKLMQNLDRKFIKKADKVLSFYNIC